MRPLRLEDANALRALWNRVARYDPLDPALFHEKVWGDPDYEPELALLVEEASRLCGFAMGVVRRSGDVSRGYVKLIAVDESRWREGIGGQLLAEVEKRLRERGAMVGRVGESAPNYLLPGLDVRYTKAMLFFEKHGYERFGETYNLDVDLSAEDFSTGARERMLQDQGFTVRRATTEDRLAVFALLDAHWAAWKDEIERSLYNEPVSLHLALKDGRVLGFSAYDTNNLGTGWFGPMGTDPETRGLGIGGVLLRRCLRDQKAQGHARAIIPWVGPVAFYAHYAGANIARIFYRYEKKLG